MRTYAPAVAAAAIIAVARAGCVDYTPDSWWRKGENGEAELVSGLPPDSAWGTAREPVSFVARPVGLTVCELEELHRTCVERINHYRAGRIPFGNGSIDWTAASGTLAPYKHSTGLTRCHNAAAVGSLALHVEASQTTNWPCSEGHALLTVCPQRRKKGQNACCLRGSSTNPLDTFDKIRDKLFWCLHQMWTEPERPTGPQGHHKLMKSKTMQQVSCSFAGLSNGRVWMRQDFINGEPGGTAHCKCGGQGTSDGCGRSCEAGPPARWYCRPRAGRRFKKATCRRGLGTRCDDDNVRCCVKGSGRTCKAPEMAAPGQCTGNWPACYVPFKRT
jgi:hypothetical protein